MVLRKTQFVVDNTSDFCHEKNNWKIGDKTLKVLGGETIIRIINLSNGKLIFTKNFTFYTKDEMNGLWRYENTEKMKKMNETIKLG